MTHVRRWLDDWTPHELGVCWEEHDQVVGAAWARRVEPVLVRSALGQPVPEVLIAVDPAHRGQGIGHTLMEALIICTEEAGEPAKQSAVTIGAATRERRGQTGHRPCPALRTAPPRWLPAGA